MGGRIQIPSSGVSSVVGRVKTKCIDPITREVIKESGGTNHVFKDSFRCLGWHNILQNANANRPQVFFTDGTRPIDDSFPFLDGVVVAWGGRGINSSGNQQGQIIGGTLNNIDHDGSLWGVPINDGRGLIYRYVIEFTPSQVESWWEVPRKVGITPQFRPRFEMRSNSVNRFILSPLHQRIVETIPPLIPTRMPGTVDNQLQVVSRRDVGYCMRQEGTAANSLVNVFIYNFFTREVKTIDVTNYSTGITGTLDRGLFVSFTTNDEKRMFLGIRSNQTAQSRVLEFEDDTFTNLIATHRYPGYNFGHTGGLEYNGTLITNFSAAYIHTNYLLQTPNTSVVHPPNNSDGFGSLGGTNSGGAQWTHTIKDGLLYTLNVHRAAVNNTHTAPIYDVAQSQTAPPVVGYIGTVTTDQSANASDTFGYYWDPVSDYNFPLVALRRGSFGDTLYEFHSPAALCAYELTDADRDIPTGSGWLVEYEIEVHF